MQPSDREDALSGGSARSPQVALKITYSLNSLKGEYIGDYIGDYYN